MDKKEEYSDTNLVEHVDAAIESICCVIIKDDMHPDMINALANLLNAKANYESVRCDTDRIISVIAEKLDNECRKVSYL